MARIRSVLGTITGSVGGITFSNGNGLNTLRQKVGPNSSNTPAQQNTRARFKLLSELFKQLGSAARSGLKSQGGQSAYNRFVGQNFYNTQADALNVASIDYSKLVLSSGSVEPLAGVSAALNPATGLVTVTFADNSNSTTALPTDRVKVLLIDKQTGKAAASDEEEITREDGSVQIDTDGQPAADLQVVAFAYRADGSDASRTSSVPVA